MLSMNEGAYAGAIETGLRLAELDESEGGWAGYFDPSAGLDITDTNLRAGTALMLENAKRYLMRGHSGFENGRAVMNESTRSSVMTGFNKHLFPIIRAGFPTNAVNELVSLQPTPRKSATIMYLDFIIGRGKGSYKAGQVLFDAQNGYDLYHQDLSSEKIDVEVLGVGDATATTFTGTLKFHDGGGVRPGTVSVTAGGVTVADDANGGWISGTGSINYRTGEYTITFGAAPAASVAVTATYRWDSEGSDNLPQLDVQISTTSVETERRAMEINYSEEAMYDAMQEFGTSLESDFIQATSASMNTEIANQLLSIMWDGAVVVGTFSTVKPDSYTKAEHIQDLSFVLSAASNRINTLTKKGYGNWIVVDENGHNIIQALKTYVPSARPKNVQGLHRIGTLGDIAVYKALSIAAMPGASMDGNILMGFKGSSWYEAGLVYAPYQALYMTKTQEHSNFTNTKGIATRYAHKKVNPNFYVRINLSNS